MFRPDTFALTVLLAFLISFGPISVDLYLPSLPEIGRVFGADTAHVQLTVSVHFLGFAVGQIVYGPLTDRLGRKFILLVAFLIYCIAALVCMTASTIDMLIGARALQALGASGAVVVGRAVVRDLYEGVRAGRQLSLMSMIMAISPVAAPLIGSVLLMLFGWRSVFMFMVAVGLFAALLVWRFLPETMPVRGPASWSGMFRGYLAIAKNPAFLANIAIAAVAFAGLFAWISGSSFVLQGLLGLSPIGFALTYATSCVGFLIGGALATHLVMRLGLDRTAGLGAFAVAVAGLAMIAAVADGRMMIITLTLAMTLYLLGLGLLLAQLTAAALTPFPDDAGSASALIGFSQQCSGAIMGTIIGYTLGATAWPIAVGMAITGCTTLALWIATRRLRTVKGAVHT